MSRHDIVWGVIVAVFVFGGYLEWFLQRMASKKQTCAYCERPIIYKNGVWTDPNATGDDLMWAETCDHNEHFLADHEPRVK